MSDLTSPINVGIITVTCLGSSAAASSCHSDLQNLIADPNTRLSHISDDQSATTERSQFQQLVGGSVVQADSICVVVNVDNSVEGSVPPSEGSLSAFAIWTRAVAKRG